LRFTIEHNPGPGGTALEAVSPDRVKFFSFAKKAISSELAFFYSGRETSASIKLIEISKVS